MSEAPGGQARGWSLRTGGEPDGLRGCASCRSPRSLATSSLAKSTLVEDAGQVAVQARRARVFGRLARLSGQSLRRLGLFFTRMVPGSRARSSPGSTIPDHCGSLVVDSCQEGTVPVEGPWHGGSPQRVKSAGGASCTRPSFVSDAEAGGEGARRSGSGLGLVVTVEEPAVSLWRCGVPGKRSRVLSGASIPDSQLRDTETVGREACYEGLVPTALVGGQGGCPWASRDLSHSSTDKARAARVRLRVRGGPGPQARGHALGQALSLGASTPLTQGPSVCSASVSRDVDLLIYALIGAGHDSAAPPSVSHICSDTAHVRKPSGDASSCHGERSRTRFARTKSATVGGDLDSGDE